MKTATRKPRKPTGPRTPRKPQLSYHAMISIAFLFSCSDAALTDLVRDMRRGRRFLGPLELRAVLHEAQARGHEVLPQCEDHDGTGRCRGHKPGEYSLGRYLLTRFPSEGSS